MRFQGYYGVKLPNSLLTLVINFLYSPHLEENKNKKDTEKLSCSLPLSSFPQPCKNLKLFHARKIPANSRVRLFKCTGYSLLCRRAVWRCDKLLFTSGELIKVFFTFLYFESLFTPQLFSFNCSSPPLLCTKFWRVHQQLVLEGKAQTNLKCLIPFCY